MSLFVNISVTQDEKIRKMKFHPLVLLYVTINNIVLIGVKLIV
jgi:hypothetical protein